MDLKNRLSLNLGWVLSSWAILLVAYLMRIGLHPFVESTDYVTIGSISTIFLLLPEWLVIRSKQSTSWTHTSELYTIVVIGFICTAGLLLGNGIISFFLAYGLWVLAASLVAWVVLRVGLEVRIPILVAASVTGVFFVLDLYHTEGVTPHFYERMVLGTAFVDTLSHAAISSMLSNHGVPSIGVDGLVEFKYHWGSHALLGGISNLASIDAIAAYNVTYPAVFVVLLFKTITGFIIRLGDFYETSVRPLAVVLILFMLMLAQSFIARPYLWMESNTIANVFMLLFMGVLLVYVKQQKALGTGIILFSILSLMVLSMLKISHGFVLVCALGFVSLRAYPSIRTVVILMLGGLTVLIFVLRYVLLIDEVPDPSITLSGNAYIYYLSKLIQLFWSNSGLPWSYLAGLILAVLIWSKRGYLTSLSSIKKAIQDRDTLEFEALVIINLTGLAGAIYVSDHGLDVFFFLSVQLLLSLCYLVYRLSRLVSGVSVSKGILWVGILAVLGIAATTKTTYLDHFVRKSNYLYAMGNLTESQQALHDLMIDLKLQAKTVDPATTAVYIAQGEHWYHGANESIMSSAFTVPSVSGLVSVGGISEAVWFSSTKRYGFDEYRNKRDGLIYNEDEIKEVARSMGYTHLLVYRLDNGNLVKEMVDL